mmetsp:Transcript_928/g.1981  ORF Transcript_928/g.1981 Transcript_928/m.1981 type:complete len:101 (-) Transcript_928:688-990(-)
MLAVLREPNAEDERRYGPAQHRAADDIRWKVFVVYNTACCHKGGKKHRRVADKRNKPVKRLTILSLPLLLLAILVPRRRLCSSIRDVRWTSGHVAIVPAV